MREGAIRKSGRIFGFVLGFYALFFGISSSPFVFALNPLKAISQYGHDIWQMEDGLTQSYVNSIIQSRSGYLWLGTQGGVIRFDGVRFSPTKNGEAFLLKASVVLVLLEDRQGNL
jgi:ligand-binding sensor domain-containing protein